MIYKPTMPRGPYKKRSIYDRFWIKVQKGPDCWELKTRPCSKGYSRVRLSGFQSNLAHRVSWELHNGKIPNGLFICHKCDNRKCIRPDHLFMGTQLDNMKDMAAKGRKRPAIGIRNRHAKLTDKKVIQIRTLYECGIPTRKLATKFRVTKRTIRSVVLRENWTHI